MSDLILHHYPTSPFAEKVRLILGYKQLAWKSVFIPMIMPKRAAMRAHSSPNPDPAPVSTAVFPLKLSIMGVA